MGARCDVYLCLRDWQRIVTSNPSPRYVGVVSEAFRTGAYNADVYSGAYGDLKAAVAALLLDREARSATLERDPSFGQLREPILKVLAVLRSLEYEPYDAGRPVELTSMLDKIGQAPFESPTCAAWP